MDVIIYSYDSITDSDIKHIKFSLLDSEYKKVQPHFILGQRNVFTTSERKKNRHNNIDKIRNETKPYIDSNYAIVKYSLRQKEISRYSYFREERNLSRGNYFLIVKYNHVDIDTITINVR
ncbi:MAG: hypothetical protein PHH30_08690 [Bacteroidales bacterium]|nr:hypothetical protein [Bacteroidales bacterium]MDD3860797.1 hypothetical protein [Bacteroidales bacterium]